jgi:hypothetical protein
MKCIELHLKKQSRHEFSSQEVLFSVDFALPSLSTIPSPLLEDRIPEKLKENHVLVQANPLYY